MYFPTCVSLSEILEGSILFITCFLTAACVAFWERWCYTLEDWVGVACCILFSSLSLLSSSSSVCLSPHLSHFLMNRETQLQKIIRNFQFNYFFFFLVRIFHIMEEFDSYIDWPFFSFKMDLYYLFKCFISSIQWGKHTSNLKRYSTGSKRRQHLWRWKPEGFRTKGFWSQSHGSVSASFLTVQVKNEH